MAEEIKKDEAEVIDETKAEGVDNDESGETKEEEIETEKGEAEDEEDFDDTNIEPETRKPKEEGNGKVEEDEDDLDEADRKRIEKIVDKKLGSKIQEIETKQEVDSFIHAKPEYAKYKNAILKYASHPSYQDVPVHNIAAIVAAKDMKKLGAKEERLAQKTVNQTKTPGTTIRKTEANINWLNASKEEVEAQRNKIYGRS